MASQSILKLIGEDGASRRGAIRNRVLMVAKLATSSSEIDVRIRDVSVTGARLEGIGLPREGESVLLKRGAFETFAKIIWRSGGDAGIQFDEAFDETELMTRLKGLPTAATADPERFRRPGFNRDDEHLTISNGRGWVRGGVNPRH